MYFKLHNKLYSCALSKGCALLELAVFFRKKRKAESKFRSQKSNLNPKARGEGKCRKVDSSNHLTRNISWEIPPSVVVKSAKILSNHRILPPNSEISRKIVVKLVKSINSAICRCQS